MEPTDKDAAMPPLSKAEKNLNIFHPGNIAYACQRDGGRYSGSHLAKFPHHEAVNEFFKNSKNFVMLDMWPVSRGDAQPDFFVLYTNFMEAEEWEDFQAIQEEVNAAMAKRREERAKAQLDTEGAEAAEAREAKRLQEVGKKCEANHGKKARKK